MTEEFGKICNFVNNDIQYLAIQSCKATLLFWNVLLRSAHPLNE